MSDAPGRPRILTEKITEAICASLARGEFAGHACVDAGVSERSFYRWMAEGEKEDASEDMARFWQACARARVEGERFLLAKLDVAAANKQTEDWKAIAWRLERLNQDRYHLKAKTEISGPDGAAIEVKTSGVVLLPALADTDK